jgi:hypothetical protein
VAAAGSVDTSQRQQPKREKSRTTNVAMQQNAALAQNGMVPISLARRKAMLGGAGAGAGAAAAASKAVVVVPRRQLVPPRAPAVQGERGGLGAGASGRAARPVAHNHPHRFVSNHANRAGTRGFRAPEVTCRGPCVCRSGPPPALLAVREEGQCGIKKWAPCSTSGPSDYRAEESNNGERGGARREKECAGSLPFG